MSNPNADFINNIDSNFESLILELTRKDKSELLIRKSLQRLNHDVIKYVSTLSTVEKMSNMSVLPDEFIKKFCKLHNVKYNDVCGKNRTKIVREVRQVLQYLFKINTIFTLNKIGELTGGRDHATVLHSIDVIENELNYFEKKYKISEYIINFD